MQFLPGFQIKAKTIDKTIYVQPDKEFNFQGGRGQVLYIFADTGYLMVTVPGVEDTFEVNENGRIVASTRVVSVLR